MPLDEILANIAQSEAIEATRAALAFLLTHDEPSDGDLDRLKRENKAAFDEVNELTANQRKDQSNERSNRRSTNSLEIFS